MQKCCSDGEKLDSSNPADPKCVQISNLEDRQEMEIVGVDLTKDPSSRKINLTLAFDSGPRGMPQCKGAAGFSILEENSWLTAKGSLVQDYQV